MKFTPFEEVGEGSKKRLRIFGAGVLLAGVLVFSRLFFVQVLMGGYYRDMALGNKLRRERIEAGRGVISDKEGEIMAGNKVVDGGVIRFYPWGETSSSLTGYLSEMKGMTGLEKQYDGILSGTAGEELVELDAYGNRIRVLGRRDVQAGRDIKTNVSMKLQQNIYTVMKKRLVEGGLSGSVVVSRVSGEILALLSLPSYDPNLFSGGAFRGTAGGDYASVEKVLSDEVKKPLFNRVIAGSFAPGSVFKILPAIAGLSERVIDRNVTILDTGEIKVGSYRFGNWYFDQYGKTEGEINIERALTRSNDIFFYKLGEMLGIDKLVTWSKRFGIGEKTGIDMPGEVSGLLPDPLWREREIGERWFLGNTYHMSIGQGDLMMTPLQVNRLAASVISGKRCVPRMVGREKKCEDLGTSEVNRETVISGMRGACESGGTAFSFFDLKGKVLCKTGTAQHGGEATKPHAWISVVIPNENEVENWVVVTVMIEAGGEGSYEAGPVAREIVDYLMKNE